VKITIEDYFNNKSHHIDATAERVANAKKLLIQVNSLLADAEANGIRLQNNPKTGTLISGNKDGDGGFRLQSSSTGSAMSSHKEGLGVDVYDPGDILDTWINRDRLVWHGLWRESPKFSRNWVHLTIRPPKSGNRSFIP
jgi:hypothetical protein